MQSKYPALLALTNVVLLVSSTILVYLGSALVAFYLLDRLDFVSVYFAVVPRIMIAIGVSTFVVALYGCYAAAASSRCNLILYSMLMMIIFVVQLAGIFAAMELRSIITRNEYQNQNVNAYLNDYKANSATRARWDALQKEFNCCGGVGFNDGYTAWRNADIGLDNAVPDSCCLRREQQPERNCGSERLSESGVTVDQHIHTHGCLTVMHPKLEGQVVPILLGYAGVGTLLALLQLLCVVFAFSYSSSIARYRKHDDAKSFRSNGAPTPHHPSVPSTPRFDHVRNHYGQENLSSVFVDEQLGYDEGGAVGVSGSNGKIIRGFADSPTSQLKEREV